MDRLKSNQIIYYASSKPSLMANGVEDILGRKIFIVLQCGKDYRLESELT